MRFKNKLKEFRVSKSLNQLELSQILEVSKSYYSKVESGYQEPSFNFLKRMKSIFSDDVSIDEIFFGK